MRSVVVAQQATFFGDLVPVRRYKFDVPAVVLRRLAEDDRARCDWCGAEHFKRARNAATFQWYGSPFESEPRDTPLCPECGAKYWDDSYVEGFFDCAWCERSNISESLGHRSYKRWIDDEEVCVDCFQKACLKDNTIVLRFIHYKDITPFDFSLHEELRDLGFEEQESLFWDGEAGVEHIRRKVINYMAEGWHLVIDQGSTSILGDEGSVSFWVKPLEPESEE